MGEEVRSEKGVLGGDEGVVEWGVRRELVGWGLVRREAGRRTPCAERAVMAHSSPEPAAGLFGGGDCLLGGASTEPRDPGLVRRESWQAHSVR